MVLLGAAAAGIYALAEYRPEPAFAWVRDYEQALRLSEASGRPVFVSFDASWCTYCARMDREVFTRQDVAAVLKGFVPLRLDAGREQERMAALHLDAVPAFAVLDADGRVVARRMGYMDGTALIRWLEEVRRRLGRGP